MQQRTDSWEPKFDSRRVLPLRWAAVGIVILLLTGFWRLQVTRADYYTRLAERNRIRELSLMAPRGRILDKNQKVLVDNYPSYSVILIREHIEVVRESLDRIARGLNLNRRRLERRLKEFEGKPPFTPIVLKKDASLSDIAFVEANQAPFSELELVRLYKRNYANLPVAEAERADLSELELVRMYRRRYPVSQLAAHMIGYVGLPTQQEIDSQGHNPNDVVGKTGLEQMYNDLLMGHDGQRRVVVNSRGKQVEVLGFTPTIPGADITLTLDHEVQIAAQKALEGKVGAIVALDPRTGNILAMASSPTFDPNIFAVRVPTKDWQKLINDPAKPLLNRAIQAQLPPGSVFKIIVAAAALEEGVVTPSSVIQCPGWARHYNRTFRCWVAKGHGAVNLHKALEQSCDVYFYEVGKRLGIERLSEYARRYGLGEVTGVDIPSEEEGLVPSAEWSRKVRGTDWYLGETISVAIGQGPINITPLQLAYSVGGILSGGRFARPRVHAGGNRPLIKSEEISEKTVALIADALSSVVNSEEGTAPSARIEGFEIAGKTSTVQVISFETRSKLGEEEAAKLKNTAWFVAAYPKSEPEIVVAVVVERGVAGAAVAPLARDVLRSYFVSTSQMPVEPLVPAAPPVPPPADKPPDPTPQTAPANDAVETAEPAPEEEN